MRVLFVAPIAKSTAVNTEAILMKEWLRAEGILCESARPADAVSHLRKGRHDLVIVQERGGDGSKALMSVKNIRAASGKVPVMVIAPQMSR